MNKKCGGLFKEFVKAIVKHTIVQTVDKVTVDSLFKI